MLLLKGEKKWVKFGSRRNSFAFIPCCFYLCFNTWQLCFVLCYQTSLLVFWRIEPYF